MLSRRVAALTAVLTLAVGLGGGYLFRWATEPPHTSQPSGTARSATVVFDGVRAVYDGPTELKLGATLRITMTSTVTGTSAVVSRLDPVPSLPDLVHDIEVANTSPAVMPLPYVHHLRTVTTGGAGSVTLAVPGTYSVWAGPVTGSPGGPTVAVATLLHVTR